MADLSTSFNPAWVADTSDVASSALDLAGTVSNVASAASSAIAARTDQSVKSAATPEFAGLDILTDNADANIDITCDSATDSHYAGCDVYIYGLGACFLNFHRAAGTIASPSIVSDSNIIGEFGARGYDGTGMQATGKIRFEIDDIPGENDMPGRIVFLTTPDGDITAAEAFRINHKQVGIFKKTVCFDAIQTATGDGTTTIDWGLGNKFYFTFGAANETFTFTAPDGPCNVVLVLKQDGTGSRTATWPNTVMWPGGTAPTLSTGVAAVDIVCFFYDGTNYFGQTSLDFSVPE